MAPPALLHALGQAARTKSAAEFAFASRDLRQTQEARLARIVSNNAQTEYGRLMGLHEVRDSRAYAARIPLIGSAELEPWVVRTMNGERHLLTREAPVYYVRTTGSTGNPKHIPITPAYKAEFQKTVHVALWHLYLRFPDAFLSTALYFVGSRRIERAPDGNDVGTMSGFNFTEMPKLIRALYAWPYELFEIGDLRTRTFLALLTATVGDPSIIAGIFPAPLVYLLRDLDEHANELAKTLRDGRLPGGLSLTASGRAFFEARLPANAAANRCAERLERARQAPVEEKVREAWPSLRLVYCWVSATASLYVPELRRRLGPHVAVRDAIYSACEGWCSIPMGDEEPGGALAITSHFFEFLAEGAKDSAHVLRAWELEDGRRYSIVLTTSAGLFRYVLGDIVEVCGFHHGVPRIRFVRKEGASSNLAGEKLEEGHVSRAMAKALSDLGLESTFFTLAPDLGGDKPGYRLYFEPSRNLTDESLFRLRAAMEALLSSESFDYGRLVSGGQLRPLVVEPLVPGTYDSLRQKRVSAGTAEAQIKAAHLIADPSAFLAELGTTKR